MFKFAFKIHTQNQCSKTITIEFNLIILINRQMSNIRSLFFNFNIIIYLMSLYYLFYLKNNKTLEK